MESGFVDLVVTSPPYDSLREYNKNTTWNFNFFEKVAKELTRVLKDGGVVVWNVNDQIVKGGKTGTSFRQALYFMDECGLKLHDTMIYQKTSARFPSGIKSIRYTQKFEFVFILSKGRPKSINLIQDKRNKWFGHTSWGKTGARTVDGVMQKSNAKTKPIKEFGVRDNIWIIKNSGSFGQKDKSVYKHPATMPQQLANDHIVSWSKPGDLVFDPFMGSGTTARAALKCNRDYLGFEIDKDYFKLSIETIDNMRKEKG